MGVIVHDGGGLEAAANDVAGVEQELLVVTGQRDQQLLFDLYQPVFVREFQRHQATFVAFAQQFDYVFHIGFSSFCRSLPAGDG